MPFFVGQKVKAEILSTRWIKAQKGTLGLEVKCKVSNENAEEEELTGTVWLNEGFLKAYNEHFTGEVSGAAGFVVGQLRALGVDPKQREIADIGDTIRLENKTVPAILGEYKGRLKIEIFGEGGGAPTAKAEDLAALRRKPAKAVAKQQAPEGEEKDEDIPF
jgi:hypothetical protein